MRFRATISDCIRTHGYMLSKRLSNDCQRRFVDSALFFAILVRLKKPKWNTIDWLWSCIELKLNTISWNMNSTTWKKNPSERKRSSCKTRWSVFIWSISLWACFVRCIHEQLYTPLIKLPDSIQKHTEISVTDTRCLKPDRVQIAHIRSKTVTTKSALIETCETLKFPGTIRPHGHREQHGGRVRKIPITFSWVNVVCDCFLLVSNKSESNCGKISRDTARRFLLF